MDTTVIRTTSPRSAIPAVPPGYVPSVPGSKSAATVAARAPTPRKPVILSPTRTTPRQIPIATSPTAIVPAKTLPSPSVLPASLPRAVASPAASPAASTAPASNRVASNRVQQFARPTPRSIPRQNPDEIKFSKMLASDHYIAETMYGTFKVPNFDIMDPRDQEKERNTLELRFKDMANLWKDTYIIEGPREGEDLRNLFIRFKENEQFLLSRTGTDLWFVGLVGAWGIIEWGVGELGFPIHGYAVSQMQQYPTYQAQMKQLRSVTSFGADWSPWTRMAVLGAGNALLLVFLSRCGGADYAPAAMRELSKILGSGNSTIEYTETGAIKPPKDDGPISKLIGMIPNNAMELATKAGGIKGGFSMITTILSTLGSKKTDTEKAAAVEKRKAGPTKRF